MIWFVCGVAVGAIAAAIVAGIHHFQYKVWIINKVFGENIPLVTPGDPEVAVLIRKGLLDARSPTGDALLDYRNPPSSPRADRLVTLERERDEARALVEGANEAELEAIGDAEDLRARLARFEALAAEADMCRQMAGPGEQEHTVSIVDRLAALAGPEGA